MFIVQVLHKFLLNMYDCYKSWLLLKLPFKAVNDIQISATDLYYAWNDVQNYTYISKTLGYHNDKSACG